MSEQENGRRFMVPSATGIVLRDIPGPVTVVVSDVETSDLSTAHEWLADPTQLNGTDDAGEKASEATIAELKRLIEELEAAVAQAQAIVVEVRGPEGLVRHFKCTRQLDEDKRMHVLVGMDRRVSADEDRLDVKVYVPLGTSIDIEDGLPGGYTIGDTHGTLSVRLHGAAGKLVAGRLSAADLHAYGSQPMKVDSVRGRHLHVDVFGDVDVTIGDGQVGELTINNAGAKTVTYGGASRRALLFGGRVQVHAVNDELSVFGDPGQITVTVPPPRGIRG